MMSALAELAPYFLILVALISASAFFSGSEVALFSLRRVDREQMARSQRPLDSLILSLLARPRRLIATLLIGNEVVNISVSVVIAGIVPRLFPSRSEIELALLATFIALPILLLLGEITPKTIAIKTSVSWARTVARPLWLFSTIITPVRIVVHAVCDVILRPFGAATAKTTPDMSEEEFKTLVDAGSAEGEVDARERRLIHRVFEFGDKTVGQVMEPREKIFALSYDLPVARLIKEVATRGYSRVPIYHKSLDDIRGVLYAKDLIVAGTGLTSQRRLGDLLHEPLFVPRTLPAARLFRTFKKRKIHLALVVNEYGKLLGMVTMEDLLEELFGEIRDEREVQKAWPRPGRPRTPAPAETEMEAGTKAVTDAASAPAPQSGPKPATDDMPDREGVS